MGRVLYLSISLLMATNSTAKTKTLLSSEMWGFLIHGMPLWGLGGWVEPMRLVVPAVEESLNK
jgi:hypothetical protein